MYLPQKLLQKLVVALNQNKLVGENKPYSVLIMVP